MPVATCSCCNKAFESHLMLKCSVCNRLFKNTCVDITASEVRIINANKGYEWSCIDCRQIGNDIKSLKALIISLQGDIKSLGEEHKGVSKKLDMEEIISEITDRERRKKNIVIFNINEQSDDNATHRIDKDRTVVTEILKTVSPDLITDDIIKPIRLGRFDATRNRPIKITLQSEDLVHMVIKKAKILKNKPKFHNISLSFDRTPRQIEYYKNLRTQLREREDSGDTNYIIKYLNGTPKIVPKTKQSLN